MKKKFLAMGAAFIMLFSVVGMMGCGNDYVFNEDDFRLTVSVDKTEARVGDIVTVTATLENLSGRNLRVQAATPNMVNLENILIPAVVPEHSDWGSYITFEGGWVRRNTFRDGAIIEVQSQREIRHEANYVAFAGVRFSIGRANSINRINREENRTWVVFRSEEILIIIQGEV